MASALDAFQRREAIGSPMEAKPRPPMVSDGLNDFLAREAMGPPLDAIKLGGAANGPVEQFEDPDAYPGGLDELHVRIIRWFEAAERASSEARKLAERDSDYRHGKQWTAAEKEALKKRGQPELTINYVRRKVELLCGLERKARTDPKAYPRTPQEEQRADAATAALRYVADANNLPVLRSAVYEDMLVFGFGGAELGLEDDGRGGADVTLAHVPWDRLWHDPHSRSPDFRDARHLGAVLWMDRDQLLDMFPDAGDVVADSFARSTDSFGDRPGHVSWQDNRRTRCRVVQCHWIEQGQWWSGTVSRAGFLADPTPSPFKDARGRSAPPLVLMSAYVDGDNNRYGAVRDLISLQDEINKRRSKALHLLTAKTVIAERGAVEDVEAARKQVSKPDGYVEVMRDFRFDIVQGNDLAVGQMNLLQHATAEMQASGPNASMAGNDPRDLSGRAILAQQAGGAAQNEPLADALRQWTRRVMEGSWLACREFWTGERWIRVTDDLETAPQWVGLNQRIVSLDPYGQMTVSIENGISDLEVDITIEEGADVPALQAEQFSQLVQLAGSMPGIIPPDVLIAASALKDKGKLLERMKAAQEQQAAAQQAQAPIAQAHAEADVRGKNAKASADEALALERQHATVARIADVHRQSAESFAVPVGPVDHPQQVPQRPQPT